MNFTFAEYGHTCEMKPEFDEVMKIYPSNFWCSRLRRFLLRSRLASPKICSPFATHLRSNLAIRKEQKRQLEFHPYAIHPYSQMRMWFQFYMILIFFLQTVTAPLHAAFYRSQNVLAIISARIWLIFLLYLDISCILEIIVNLMTGYYDKNEKIVLLDFKSIAMQYIKNMLLLDILSSIPAHWDIFNESLSENTNISIIMRIVILLKCLHYFTLVKYYKMICKIYNLNYYIARIISIIVSLCLLWHFLSCLQIFMYDFRDGSKHLHLNTTNQDMTFFLLWSDGLYHGAMFICLSAFGTDIPDSNLELMVVSGLYLLCALVQIYILASVMELLKGWTSSEYKYSKMAKQLIEYMRHKQLPMFMQKRILFYYKFRFQKSYFNESEICDTISSQLQQEILMQSCRTLIEDVDFFRHIPLNLFTRIMSTLQMEIYLPNDVIIRANNPGSSMYFISSGTVAIYTATGKEVCHLYDGAHFGEIALLMQDDMRIATVVAVEVCELYCLNRNDFHKAISPYPDLLEKMKKIATDRMEKTVIMDEYNQTE